MGMGRIPAFMVFLLAFNPVSVSAQQPLQEFYERGEAAYRQGNYKKAVQEYEKAVEIDPNFAPAYNALGLAHQAMQDKLSDVIWLFKVAVEIDPQYADAYHNMCRAYYQAGKHNEAEQSCRKALAVNPDMLNAKLSLAWIYLVGKQQPADAVLYFQQVLTKIQSPMIYFGLGLAYAQSGDRPRVLEVITALRNQGENNLATQLERSMMTPAQPQLPEEFSRFSLPVSPNTSRLIESTPKPQPSITEDSSAQQFPTMKIRLRGTLNTVPVPGEDKEDATQPIKHPGSLSYE
ncbi:MAG TPA: tetratricopeptide repeat protein [Candidatus Omnitrophota bacterium]|nr:tetratricopeptide repeat protein [Candidatus Omnitrophota bacterium]HPB67556.1 tetratricopeptide repeat protein [Candidatus Omnitrophota bacterium]HQO59031.1 tetratricopeptide repeat protein [Candidatus Omnitrophota bacterium]HQP12515.1 tetratricopeptide repeat protein [Candidatus Omnitrophota bacterium]